MHVRNKGTELVDICFSLFSKQKQDQLSLQVERLHTPDGFFHNQQVTLTDKAPCHHMPTQPGLLGIVGKEAFHIFDSRRRTWLSSCSCLGYDRLAKFD